MNILALIERTRAGREYIVMSQTSPYNRAQLQIVKNRLEKLGASQRLGRKYRIALFEERKEVKDAR